MGSSVPESWNFRRAWATSSRQSGLRSSSAVSSRPFTNAVTRQGGFSSMAATLGAMPSFAAASLAWHSAWRSMPSTSVRLPGRRTT